MDIKQLHLFYWERLSNKCIINILDNVLQVNWCYSYSLFQSKPSPILVIVNTYQFVFHTLSVDIFTAVSLHSVGGSLTAGPGGPRSCLTWIQAVGCNAVLLPQLLILCSYMGLPHSVLNGGSQANAAVPLKARQQNSYVGFIDFLLFM